MIKTIVPPLLAFLFSLNFLPAQSTTVEVKDGAFGRVGALTPEGMSGPTHMPAGVADTNLPYTAFGLLPDNSYSKFVVKFNTVDASALRDVSFQSAILKVTLLLHVDNANSSGKELLTPVRAILFASKTAPVTVDDWDATPLATFDTFDGDQELNVQTASATTLTLSGDKLNQAISQLFDRLSKDTYLGLRLEFKDFPTTVDKKTHAYNMVTFLEPPADYSLKNPDHAKQIPNLVFTVLKQ